MSKRDVPVLGAITIGAYLVLYVLARTMNAIPPPLIPFMDNVAGLLVVSTIPFILWYGGFLVGLGYMVTMIVGIFYAFIRAIIALVRGEEV